MASVASTVALCSLAFAYYYFYHHHLRHRNHLLHPHHHHSNPPTVHSTTTTLQGYSSSTTPQRRQSLKEDRLAQEGKERSRDNDKSGTNTIVLPEFVSIEGVGTPAVGSSLSTNNNNSNSSDRFLSISPTFLFSTATTTALSSASSCPQSRRSQPQQVIDKSGDDVEATTPSISSPLTSAARREEVLVSDEQNHQWQLDKVHMPQGVMGQSIFVKGTGLSKSRDSFHDITERNTTTTMDLHSSSNSNSSTFSDSLPSPTPRQLPWPAVEVIQKEIVESIRRTHPDHRIWDHIVVGEGYETLQAACQLARQHPTKTVLALLEDDIRPSLKNRVVHWMQKILTAQAQRWWSQEAKKAVPASLHHQLGVSSSPEAGKSLPRETTEATFDKPLAQPSNLSIGSLIRVCKILVDKDLSSTTTPTTTTPTAPRPIRRFSSIGGGDHHRHNNNLTINTTTATLIPPQTLGLEIMAINGLQGYRVFCNDGVVFATAKHPLLGFLDGATTPPTSKDGLAGRRSSLPMSDTPTKKPKMTFSITVQHLRSVEDQQSALMNAKHKLLDTAIHFLDQFLDENIEVNSESSSWTRQNPNSIQPVLLYRSTRVVQNGRVRLKDFNEDVDTNDVFHLEISAVASSLDSPSPIQVQVIVETQPIQQDAFGNTEAIRKGEVVLMEGLDLARQMARAAGWTCLAEDDCQMVEWVRDQMSIQWSHDPLTMSEAALNPLTVQQASSRLAGVSVFVRSRKSSNGSARVRTPNLTPYASRTQSYRRKRREECGSGDRRDSTLERLQGVSENLQAHRDQSGSGDEEGLGIPKVTIAAATAGSHLSDSGDGNIRTGLKTSFGGFSSLNDTRIQTLALAEQTKDHLGMALAMAPASPKDLRQSTELISTYKGAFSEGVGPLENGLGLDSQKPISPKPKSLSRFSIKTYQMERENHGLSDEWALGVGLDLTFGASPLTATSQKQPTAAGARGQVAMAALSMSKDLLSTPPLIAENTSLTGNVSPLTPTPDNLPSVNDFLHNGFMATSLTSGTRNRLKSFDRNTHYSHHSHGNDDEGIGHGRSYFSGFKNSENSNNSSGGVVDDREGDFDVVQDLGGEIGVEDVNDHHHQSGSLHDNSNMIDNSSRKSGFFTCPTRFGGGGGSSKGGSNSVHGHGSPLEAPVELVHDFLGDSFSAPAHSLRFSRPLSRNDPGGASPELERMQSAPAMTTGISRSSHLTGKTVHFADHDFHDHYESSGNENESHEQQEAMEEGGWLHRAHSDPVGSRTRKAIATLATGNGDVSTAGTGPTLNSSKSKAHTRRSWGQGIGGNDILGIQGLS